MPTGEMLGQALRGLGVPEAELPSGLDDQGFAFQARSAGRRSMMVVRDVADVEQVTLLVPHSAPGAVVVVSGRAMLRGLVMLNLVDVPLGRLPREDARSLLAASIGADDVPARVVDELAAICDDVPLLLRILGAQLRHRAPSAIERHLRQLRASDAALLELEHAQRLVKFLEVTESLVREQQTALRRLALLPEPDLGVAAAAVALDLDADAAEQMLEVLADKHVVIWDKSRDRYSLYRMVRAHAPPHGGQCRRGPRRSRRCRRGSPPFWRIQRAKLIPICSHSVLPKPIDAVTGARSRLHEVRRPTDSHMRSLYLLAS